MKTIKVTFTDMLFNYLASRRGKWINGGTLEEYSMSLGKKGSTGSRTLRLLHQHGMIHRNVVKNKNTGVSSVWYSVPK